MRHGIGLVNEKLDALASAENLFDVLDHDIFDLIEFGLGACDFVLWGGGVVSVH